MRHSMLKWLISFVALLLVNQGQQFQNVDAEVSLSCVFCVYAPIALERASFTESPVASTPTVRATTIAVATVTDAPLPTETPLPLPTETPLPLPTETPPPSGLVSVRKASAFRPYTWSSSQYIVGEIRNETSSTIRFAKITAIFRNDAGAVVGTDYTYAYIGLIIPNSNSPFLMIVNDEPTWTTVDFLIEYRETDEQPYVMEFTVSDAYLDSYDAIHVPVQVTNQDSVPHTFVKVFTTLYGTDGRVIGVDSSYTSPSTLAPGESAMVDVEFYFWDGKPDMSQIAGFVVAALDDSPTYRSKETDRVRITSPQRVLISTEQVHR